MAPSGSQYRVVDPVLTTHARGYSHPDRVGHLLFPVVTVGTGAGKVVEFGKESFMLYNARRAPGASTRQIEFGYLGKPFELVQDSLDAKVPREYARDAAAVPGIDLGMRAVNLVMNTLTLGLEYEQAQLATNPANYDANHKLQLAGTSQWTDPASKPVADIEAARQAIRSSCGLYPNVMVLGPAVYGALKSSAQITDRFKNTDIVTSKMLAALFELDQVVEGRSVVSDNDGQFSDVWGNYAILAYAPNAPSGFEEPSFGYTYTMKDNPLVEVAAWDSTTKSHIYGVTYERAPVIAGMSAGFLIQDPVAV